MRYIPDSLKAKMRLLSQTKANNADPRLEAIISRHMIPIQDYRMWQTHKVADFTGRVSIAVPRPDYRRMPEQILVGGLDNGTIKIYSAAFDGINAPEIWNKILELPNAVDFSMAYLGKYRPYRRVTEFYTSEAYPWIVWIDSSGSLYAQYWDDASTKVILGTNATSCSATMGLNSIQGDWGYGLMVAWTTVAGTVFYAQRDIETGVWGEGITVTQAPANALEVTLSRVADARMMLLVRDSNAVTALYFRSIAISLSNYEQIQVLNPKVNAGTTPITFHDVPLSSEQVEVVDTTASPALLSILAPVIESVANIDDGTGNFGKVITMRFKERIYGFDSQQPAFTLKGSSGPTYYCQSIIRGEDLSSLVLNFQDFNNAPGNCTITYMPGTLQGDLTLAPSLTVTFSPDGLIPTIIPTPISLSAFNSDNGTLFVDFDLEVISTDFSANVDAFTVSCPEPLHVPKEGAADVTTTYTVSNVGYPPVAVIYTDSFFTGTKNNVQVSGGVLSLTSQGGG